MLALEDEVPQIKEPIYPKYKTFTWINNSKFH